MRRKKGKRMIVSDIYPVDTKKQYFTCEFINMYPFKKNKGHIINGYIQCSTTNDQRHQKDRKVDIIILL